MKKVTANVNGLRQAGGVRYVCAVTLILYVLWRWSCTCSDVDLVRAVTLISYVLWRWSLTRSHSTNIWRFAVVWPVAVAYVSTVSAAALTTRPRCFHHRSFRCTAGRNSLACLNCQYWLMVLFQPKRQLAFTDRENKPPVSYDSPLSRTETAGYTRHRRIRRPREALTIYSKLQVQSNSV